MKIIFKSLLILIVICSCNNKNRLQLDFGPFNPNDFEIYLHPGIGWDSDRIEYIHPLIIYKDGIYNDFDVYKGPNAFFIKYKGQLQCRFSQLILNERRKHRYKFVFFGRNDALFCSVKIIGKYRMKDTIPFTPIEN